MDTVETLRIKTSHYFIAGFSVVVGLTWNDTIKMIIHKVFPSEMSEILIKIIYSLILTLILILIIKHMPNTTSELPYPVRKEIEKFYNIQKR
jgi:hypothetical protein